MPRPAAPVAKVKLLTPQHHISLHGVQAADGSMRQVLHDSLTMESRYLDGDKVFVCILGKANICGLQGKNKFQWQAAF